MQCDRCGETMRPETVITLRRSFGRVRASQQQAAHCMNCGVSRPLSNVRRAVPLGCATGLRSPRLVPKATPGILELADCADGSSVG